MVLRLQALFLLLSFSLFAEEIVGRVVRVADGDTLTVLATTGTTGVLPVGNGRTGTTGVSPVGNAPTGTTGILPVGNVPVQHKVRLQGIDAPEKKQPFGRAAGRYLSGLVANREVRVTYTKRDRYQRILGTVYLDGRDVNLEMLKAGYAWHYRRFDSNPAYAQAESAARTARRGLWQDKNQTEPEQFRKAKRTKK